MKDEVGVKITDLELQEIVKPKILINKKNIIQTIVTVFVGGILLYIILS